MTSGSGSGATTSSTTTSAPPTSTSAAYNGLVSSAENLATQPLTQYSGSLVAGFTPLQNQGFTDITNANGIAVPYINSAAGLYGSSTKDLWSGLPTYNSANIAKYEDPYTSAVTSTTENLFNTENKQNEAAVQGNATTRGAYGGDREAVAQALQTQTEKLVQDPVLADIQYKGYQSAQQEFNNQQATQLSANTSNAWLNQGAAYGVGALGTEAQNTALAGANAELGAGKTQQNLAQENLNVPYEQFTQAQAYPYKSLNFLSGIVEGTGAASGGTGTSTTTTPAPSVAGTVAGTALVGAGLYSGLSSGSSSTNTSDTTGGYYDRGGRIGQQHYATGGGTISTPAASQTPEGGLLSVGPGVPTIDSSFIPDISVGSSSSSATPKAPTTTTTTGGGSSTGSDIVGGVKDAVSLAGLGTTLSKIPFIAALFERGGSVHHANYDDGGVTGIGGTPASTTGAPASVPHINLDYLVAPGPVVKGAGPPKPPSSAPAPADNPMKDFTSAIGTAKSMEGIGAGLGKKFSSSSSSGGTDNGEGGDARGGRIGLAYGGGADASIPLSADIAYSGSSPNVQNSYANLLNLPLDRLQQMAVQFPSTTQQGQMIARAIQAKKMSPNVGAPPATGAASSLGQQQQQPASGVATPIGAAAATSYGAQPQSSAASSAYSPQATSSIANPNTGLSSSQAYASGGSTGDDRGFVTEDELDPHPIVDHSGDTIKIRYPSEGKVLDLGMPSIKAGMEGAPHGRRVGGRAGFAAGGDTTVMVTPASATTTGSTGMPQLQSHSATLGAGFDSSLSGSWFNPLPQYGSTSTASGMKTYPGAPAYTPGIGAIYSAFRPNDVIPEWAGGAAATAIPTAAAAPVGTTDPITSTAPAPVAPGTDSSQVNSRRGGRIGYDDGGDVDSLSGGTADASPPPARPSELEAAARVRRATERSAATPPSSSNTEPQTDMGGAFDVPTPTRGDNLGRPADVDNPPSYGPAAKPGDMRQWWTDTLKAAGAEWSPTGGLRAAQTEGPKRQEYEPPFTPTPSEQPMPATQLPPQGRDTFPGGIGSSAQGTASPPTGGGIGSSTTATPTPAAPTAASGAPPPEIPAAKPVAARPAPPAQPAAAPARPEPAPEARVPAQPPQLAFFGDSVAHGTQQAMNAPGATHDGWTPDKVLGSLTGANLKGQTAVISSGITNSTPTPGQWQKDIALVPQQIDAARSAGASGVVLYGVGEGVRDNKNINERLAEISAAKGATFVPLIGTGAFTDAKGVQHPAGWHPNDYGAMGQATMSAAGGPAATAGQASAAGRTPPANTAPAPVDQLLPANRGALTTTAGQTTPQNYGPVAQGLVQEARRQGVPESLVLKAAQVESGMGSNLGTRGNVLQLGPQEWAQVGGGNMSDPATQYRNGVAWLAKSQGEAKQALGRDPQDWESYVVHQQGQAGGSALLTANPGASAVDVLTPAHGGNRPEAQHAIIANGGSLDMTAGQFVDNIKNRFEGFGSRQNLTATLGTRGGTQGGTPGVDQMVGPGTGQPGIGAPQAAGTTPAQIAQARTIGNQILERTPPQHRNAMAEWMNSPSYLMFLAGAGMLASRSPFPGVAIGEGLLTAAKGAQTVQAQDTTAQQAEARGLAAETRATHANDLGTVRAQANADKAANNDRMMTYRYDALLQKQAAGDQSLDLKRQIAEANATRDAGKLDLARANLELAGLRVQNGEYAPPVYGQGPSDTNDPNSPKTNGLWYAPKMPRADQPNGGAMFIPSVGTAKPATGENAILHDLVTSGAAKDPADAIRVHAALKRDPNSEPQAFARLVEAEAARQQNSMTGMNLTQGQIEAKARANVNARLQGAPGATPAAPATTQPAASATAPAQPATPAAQPTEVIQNGWRYDARTHQPIGPVQ